MRPTITSKKSDFVFVGPSPRSKSYYGFNASQQRYTSHAEYKSLFTLQRNSLRTGGWKEASNSRLRIKVRKNAIRI